MSGKVSFNSMAIISVSGESDGPHEELAGLIAERLPAELINEARLQRLIEAEFPSIDIPEKAWKYVVQLILAKLADGRHLVVSAPNTTGAIREIPNSLRVGIPGKKRDRPQRFDLALNPLTFNATQMLEIVHTAVQARGNEPDAHVEFNARLQLAKFGIAPSHDAPAAAAQFTHPSEQIFANLLDFYRIRWEYEPRSFPLQWDKDGKVTEAFTPDFFLPEFDLYVELTTMKQSLVTKKNRKVRMLRAIYPHINIQVFYQKDFEELVSKYGLGDRMAE